MTLLHSHVRTHIRKTLRPYLTDDDMYDILLGIMDYMDTMNTTNIEDIFEGEHARLTAKSRKDFNSLKEGRKWT